MYKLLIKHELIGIEINLVFSRIQKGMYFTKNSELIILGSCNNGSIH